MEPKVCSIAADLTGRHGDFAKKVKGMDFLVSAMTGHSGGLTPKPDDPNSPANPAGRREADD